MKISANEQMNKQKKKYFLDALKNTIFPFTKRTFTWVLSRYHFLNKNTKKLENEKKKL